MNATGLADCSARAALPATPPAEVERVKAFERELAKLPQATVVTQHVFHAGMYARTIKLVRDQLLTGALIKRATLLIVMGEVDVSVGAGKTLHLKGYHVLPASAYRKQVFLAHAETYLTMIFPTQAKTVDEAEREFTDEFEALASRQGINDVIATGE